MLYVVAVLACLPLAFAWEIGLARWSEMRRIRAVCQHTWGPAKKATIGYKTWCAKCHTQEFCHEDGTLCPFPCETCGRGVR